MINVIPNRRNSITIQEIIEFTNSELKRWYCDVKDEYGVIGDGEASYDAENNVIRVVYTENGVINTWEICFYPEYVENGINWVFNCWM